MPNEYLNLSDNFISKPMLCTYILIDNSEEYEHIEQMWLVSLLLMLIGFNEEMELKHDVMMVEFDD